MPRWVLVLSSSLKQKCAIHRGAPKSADPNPSGPRIWYNGLLFFVLNMPLVVAAAFDLSSVNELFERGIANEILRSQL